MKTNEKLQFIETQIEDKLKRYFNETKANATKQQLYTAAAAVTRDILLSKRNAFNAEARKQNAKTVYYICMEFLVGQSLKTNLFNLGLTSVFEKALSPVSLEELFSLEPDAGLGNGGLGRLAACYMDSLASLDYPAMGFCLRYDFGLFRQKMVDGWQTELPDDWLPGGGIWLTPRTDKEATVRFYGQVKYNWQDGRMVPEYTDCEELLASPQEMMISGYDSKGVSVLRLWTAKNKTVFDLKSFGMGDYARAMARQNEAELLTKVLYPADSHAEGKALRLKQQYFLVSASLQNIVQRHLDRGRDIRTLHEFAAIHINDTHPALCVPELMRILLDDFGLEWGEAFEITEKCLAYTNHTVMAEALEEWDQSLVQMLIPRVYDIICEIDKRHNEHLRYRYHDEQKIKTSAIMYYHKIRMANLAIVGSHSVNGVSALHSQIIKDTIFRDLHDDQPAKFRNVTNGIAARRWLCQSNPALSDLIKELIGDGFVKDFSQLVKLKNFQDDGSVLKRWAEIKHGNKEVFADYLLKTSGVKIDPDTRFDVQAKRIHEYKRQLLNVLNAIALFNTLKDAPDAKITPQTIIFAGKAAPGYFMAKEIIRLVCALSSEIEKHQKIKEKLNVVFLENYCVTMAEKLMPATEVSEQISLAGKEASGTGNMKFMLNGALTLGTLDGANVEIAEAVGKDNIFLFGNDAKQVSELWDSGYNSTLHYTNNAVIRGVVDTLHEGLNGVSFSHIADYLLTMAPVADPYMCFADFDSYSDARQKIEKEYQNKQKWNKKSLLNTANAGCFSADRSVKEYAQTIWNIKQV